jgi:hypothetical protein
MLKVSMHQPNFLPYSGFFEKIARSDLFVIVDHLTFSKGKDNWHHRNRIRVPNGEGWDYITLPVSEHWNWKPFTEARLSDNAQFKKKKHLKTLVQNYFKAPYFDRFFHDFSELYYQDNRNLADFNVSLIKWFMKKFRIRTPVLRASEIGFDPSLTKDDMIIDMMRRVNGTHFLSGDGARSYIQPGKFEEAGIPLEFQNFSPEPYPQMFNDFVPYLSAFDMLMNVGKLHANGHSLKPAVRAPRVPVPLKPNGGD